MTLTPEVFVSRYPQLYHVAESGSWPSIERRGLLSTTALLDLFQASGDKRIAIESRRRSTSITICHPEHGLAVVRDQKPLNEAKLRRALVNLEPAEWYAELNRRVFFWPTLKQVRSLLQARPYRDRVHTVITVDSALLLARHLEHTELSPINSGATLFNPAPRGRGTFVPLLAYPDEWWKKRRLAEVAILYGVPDIREMVVELQEWRGPHSLRVDHASEHTGAR